MNENNNNKKEYLLNLFKKYVSVNGDPDLLMEYAIAEGYSKKEAKEDIIKVDNLWQAIEIFVGRAA